MAQRVASKDFTVHVYGEGRFHGSYTEFDDGSIVIDTVFDDAANQTHDEELEAQIHEQILYPDRFDDETGQEYGDEEEEDR